MYVFFRVVTGIFPCLAVRRYFTRESISYSEETMEIFIRIIIPALLALFLLRLLILPMKLIWKLLCNSGCGLICLWLLNTASAFTGLYLPINAVTVFLSGFFGLPGIGLVALLEILK